ncbi:stringent starvation protein B [Coxiella burnetii RSA 331]|nr:stringent starvation protein B [Coxiella burnetii Dugway 5J108-111]ABX78680.1 stringent starvation protein B [Coxiella burnetii RSA 331]
MAFEMNSSRPYLVRAIYDWVVDNQLTPYIMVDALMPDVEVPERFVENGKIVLNIEPQAVGRLRMGNDAVEFDARFSGVAHHIFIPVRAIKAIYAFENGRGMVFTEDEDGGNDGRTSPPSNSSVYKPVKKGRPNLKIVK